MLAHAGTHSVFVMPRAQGCRAFNCMPPKYVPVKPACESLGPVLHLQSRAQQVGALASADSRLVTLSTQLSFLNPMSRLRSTIVGMELWPESAAPLMSQSHLCKT